MSCEGCIFERDRRSWNCDNCVEGSRKLVPAPKPPERERSAWERRWIRWAKKQKPKGDNKHGETL